ncbi:MAG: SDR family NAD(P)-dependent oxidoreductase [Solirubrobacterales bacterium]|nr:SDR family NAD(P)-dependent oxidoreductase [Solirubrobacterales bacterium]
MSSGPNHPLALVTGASSGIGYELARQFAEHGFDLVIAAEDEAIDSVAQQLSESVAVEAVRVDLTTEEGVHALWERVRAHGRPIDAAALNAGIGMGGASAGDAEESQELKLGDLNIRSAVHLTKHVVEQMVDQGEGRILFTSSTASTMPGSGQAVHDASKSFVQTFARALRKELKDTGVTVTLLVPGPTDTEFLERAGLARDGFEALMSGDERVVSRAKARSRAPGWRRPPP